MAPIKIINKRLLYIDVAKGILIWMVILGHISYFILPYSNDPICSNVNPLLSFFCNPYYLPAFFMVTGYCSHFDKDFVPFLWSNIKALKIPAVTLTAIWLIVRKICSGDTDPISYLHIGLVHSWIESDFWFLDALFLAKMVYWLINKCVKNKTLQLLLPFLVFCIGYYLAVYIHIHEVGSFVHAMLLMLFMAIGQYIKKYDITAKVTMVCVGIYLFFSIFNLVLGIKQPIIVGGIHVDNSNIVQYLFQAVSGSFAVIGLCKIWGQNRFFEYCGRKSLIFYCVHIMILFEIRYYYVHVPQDNILLSLAAYIFVLISIFLICSISSWIFETKYGKYFVGKF